MRDILFKGFYPDKSGKTTMTLNGEKIRGEWVQGYYAYQRKSLTDIENHFILTNNGFGFSYVSVIPETVVIYVKQDKKDKFMFVGDIVKSAVSDDIPHGEIRYDEELCKFYVSINDGYETIDIDEYEPIVIGNKWEIDNDND